MRRQLRKVTVSAIRALRSMALKVQELATGPSRAAEAVADRRSRIRPPRRWRGSRMPSAQDSSCPALGWKTRRCRRVRHYGTRVLVRVRAPDVRALD